VLLWCDVIDWLKIAASAVNEEKVRLHECNTCVHVSASTYDDLIIVIVVATHCLPFFISSCYYLKLLSSTCSLMFELVEYEFRTK